MTRYDDRDDRRTIVPRPTPLTGPARLLREMFVLALGALSLVYLLNPGFGVIELLPDALPIVGNLDEAAATVVLLNVLAYYGLDLRRVLPRRDDRPALPPERDDRAR